MIIRIFDRLQARYAAEAFCRRIGVRLGSHCRLINVSRNTFGSEPYLISIGDHVTITSEVRFITHDGSVWVFRDLHPDLEVVRPITVGNNVFIGLRAIILPGTVIGNNVVIGAGAVVRGIIPDDCVAAGVPARRICTREEYRSKALARGFMSRSLSVAQKRRLFGETFFGSGPSGSEQ